MRSKLLLAALPAALLGLAACDDQTAQNNTQPGAAPSTAERPATAPPPAGSPGGAPSATTPGAGRPAGSSGTTQ